MDRLKSSENDQANRIKQQKAFLQESPKQSMKRSREYCVARKYIVMTIMRKIRKKILQ